MSVILWPNGKHVSEHFTIDEFACHDAHETPYPAEWVESRLMPLCTQILEPIRAYVGNGAEMKILSGYRTPEWNAAQPGAAPDSQHIYGTAADFYFPSMEGTQGPAVYLAVLALCRAGEIQFLGGIGRYTNRCHVDIRGDGLDPLATWDMT
jgi:uncharacterized protein YcbK (DUF882 family)